MEEDWWGGDSPHDSASDAPKEIVISGPGGSGNTLTGGVNQISEDDQNGVWGQVDQKDSTRSRSVIWFLTGLIVVPVLLGGISTFLGSMEETGGYDEEYSQYPVLIGSVTIDDRTFETYGFSVSPDFHYDFDDPSFWSIGISGDNWGSWLDSYDFGDSDLQAVDSQGSQWQSMWTYTWSSEFSNTPEIYIRVESNFVHVAFNLNECSECGQPEYFSYYSDDYPENQDVIAMVMCLLWPVAIIAGVVWGYATGRKPFAYGLMSFCALAAVGVMLLFGLLVMAFGW
ncbi:MAG TPA: hypothetical protein D7H76_00490 [Candidatus Poseidoniales archaeon]|nr:MAG TPA: hypothetical protein D7H76_00490 [Candidatus Poseidoniales archaeon]HII52238.1 hypothetical protein [Candidatus Thalassarchaeaceae archaeon]